jgi:uncharacterized protein
VLRTALTGTHALLTGEIVTDLNTLMEEHGFGGARELIEQKSRGELAELPEPIVEHWSREVERAFHALDDALARSRLPDEPIQRRRDRCLAPRTTPERLVMARIAPNREVGE